MADSYIFLFIIWGAWLCWTLYTLESLQPFLEKLKRFFIWSHGIVIPLMLTIFLPVVLESSLIEGYPKKLTTYLLPVIAFFLGDLAARRRNEQAKKEIYRKALRSVYEEANDNKMSLDDSLRALTIEQEDLRICDNEYVPFTSTFTCETRFLDVFLNNANASSFPNNLYNDARVTIHGLKCVNRDFSLREEIIYLLDSPKTKQQDRANYLEKLTYRNQIASAKIINLNNAIDQLQHRIITTLEKTSIQFSDLIEF